MIACKHCLCKSPKKCVLCGMTRRDYTDADREKIGFLRDIWVQARRSNQRTTGVPELDTLVTQLWGPPHTNYWLKPYAPKPPAPVSMTPTPPLVRVPSAFEFITKR